MLITYFLSVIFLYDFICMALYSLYCAEVPLRNCSLTHSRSLRLVVVDFHSHCITYCCTVRSWKLSNRDISLSRLSNILWKYSESWYYGFHSVSGIHRAYNWNRSRDLTFPFMTPKLWMTKYSYTTSESGWKCVCKLSTEFCKWFSETWPLE